MKGTRTSILYGCLLLYPKLKTAPALTETVLKTNVPKDALVRSFNSVSFSDSYRKQERRARLWAYNKQIGLRGLISAYEHGCQNRYEIAEYLEVTDEFLADCIECYRQKYGIGTTVDNYYIMFIPNLTIGKIK